MSKVTKAKPTKKVVKSVESKKKVTKRAGVASSNKKYFTIGEDLAIHEKISNNKGSMSENIRQLVTKLNRSYESIRDRIKRYHKKMSNSDKNILIKEAKTNPSKYAHFLNSNNGRKLEKISHNKPILQNRVLKRKPRVSKKPVINKVVNKEKKNIQEKVRWIIDNFKSSDAYFSLTFQDDVIHDLNMKIKAG